MQPDWLPKWLSWFLEWMHQEQAIIAAIVALTGALFAARSTVNAIRRQIFSQQDQWNDERHRALRAQRARLVFALSEFIDYNKRYYLVCREIFDHYEPIRSGELSVPEAPEIPEAALDVTFSVLSQSLPEDVAQTLERIIYALQVYHSRLCDGLSMLRAKNQFFGISDQAAFAKRTQECLYFESLVNVLFNFARNESENVGEFPSAEQAVSGLKCRGMSEDYRNAVERYIEQSWDAYSVEDNLQN